MQQVNQRTPRIKLAPLSMDAVIKWRGSLGAEQQQRCGSAVAEQGRRLDERGRAL